MTVRIKDELCADLEEYLKYERRSPMAHRLLGRLIQARETHGHGGAEPDGWPAVEINGEWFRYDVTEYEPFAHAQKVRFVVPADKVPSLARACAVNVSLSSLTLWPSATSARYRFFGCTVVALEVAHESKESTFTMRIDADEPRPEHSNG